MGNRRIAFYLLASSSYMLIAVNQENIVVRINHEKFLILFRNKELVALAERRLGKTTSLVYSQLLKGVEDKLQRCQDSIGGDEEEADPKKSELGTPKVRCRG